MSPFLSSRGFQEDFVLTISDNESNVPDWENEEPFDALTNTSGRGNSKKRKRDDGLHGLNGKADKPKSQEAENQEGRGKKKRNLPRAGALDAQHSAEDDEEDGSATGSRPDDDGAMDSEFEFQIGDVDAGVLGDFDAWGTGLGEWGKDAGEWGGEKKGIDVDEIIARKRERRNNPVKGGEGHEKATVDKAEDAEDNEGREGAEGDDDGFDGFNDFDNDDELLAEYGFGMGAVDQDEEQIRDGVPGNDSQDGSELEDVEASDDDAVATSDSVAEPVPHPDDLGSEQTSEDEAEDPVEAEKRAAFFAPEEDIDGQRPQNAKIPSAFSNMSLSRPILRGLAAVSFSEPTPIQAKTIPLALLGKDIVGGAVTGSGKTAAFMIPILERLLYRPKKVPTTRVAILMPTRELAVQCFNVANKLASFTDVTFAQIVGGFSLREQEQVLKKRPDVVIATPGRFIDHMRNSPSFAVDTLEILVLDEADRMLEDGFADELNEILNTIPKSRQTMLFSATMTASVDQLVRVGLKRPVRLLVDARKQTVAGLVQEFVRLRPGREDKRLAYLLWLCENVYTDRVIIFFRQKKEAHRVKVVFGLCGLKGGELHGSMSQEQRINAVESFRSGKASFLLATDLASRGLDIRNVGTVINYEAPQTHEIYLHRVGRTARAGRSGRSCTIAAEPDRKVVKAAVKTARAQGAKVVSRVVDIKDADACDQRLKDLEAEVEEVLREEKEERQLKGIDMQVRKGENLIKYEDEINSRPKRTWFESESDKRTAKRKGMTQLNGVLKDGKSGGVKEKKGRLGGKEKKGNPRRKEQKGKLGGKEKKGSLRGKENKRRK